MDIWAECRDSISPEYISNDVIRVVESQEQTATNSIVDNLEEQDVLEHMLEDTKPALPAGGRKLHYLLATPFRYPPLKHGSRFGTRFEPSLFYGSLTLTAAFAETGYYRFLFWLGMSVPPPSDKFVTQHTIFAVAYKTTTGLKLQNKPFSNYEKFLTSPESYSVTQQLGTAMRNAGINAFEYTSARDLDHNLNVALFYPGAFASSQPLYQQQWLCETNATTVSFYSSTDGTIHKYPIHTYLVNSVFPAPAA